MESNPREDYPLDCGYVYDHVPELAPAHMRLALVNAGWRPPPPDRPMRYCELGFGQGVTLNVLACLHPGSRFVGNDFNPEHVQFARTLADVSGADVRVFEDSFEAFAARDHEPFDYIVAHGIWSWVHRSQWDHLVRFVREHLKPGGVFQLSYNALPGWARFMPMRELVATAGRLALPPDAAATERLAGALALAQGVAAQPCGYFEFNPAARERLGRLRGENPHYLAHEYLNPHWTPTYFHEVESRLREARVGFACQAQLTTHLDFLELDEAQREHLRGIAAPTLRETVRDYFCNRQFRRDLYVKGAARLSPIEQREALEGFGFALRRPARAVAFAIDTPRGRADLDADLYRTVLARLEREPARALPLAELAADPALAPHGFDAVYQALFLLVAKGDVGVVDVAAPVDAGAALRLNRWILQQATRNLGLPLLADPVAGGVLRVEHAEQLFLDAVARGVADESRVVGHADALLRRTGRRADGDGPLGDDPVRRRERLAARLEAFRGGLLRLIAARGLQASNGSAATRIAAIAS